MLITYILRKGDEKMGMSDWIARKGNIGGTARWAAKSYKVLAGGDENIELSMLFEALIRHRYAVLPNPEQENRLLSTAGQLRGLNDLVVAILAVEAGFRELPIDTQQKWRQIIDEELEKANIPARIIYG